MSETQLPSLAERVRAEPDPRKRAELLGIDFGALLRTTWRIRVGGVAVLMGELVLVALPVGFAIEPGSVGSWLAAAIGAMVSMALVALIIALLVQVLVRFASRLLPVSIQTTAAIAQPILEVVGIYVVILMWRDYPGAVIGVLCGSIFRAVAYLGSASSLAQLIRRNSRSLVWAVEQHRSVPATATALGHQPGAIINLVGGRGLTSIGVALLLWLNPALVVTLALVSAAVNLALNALLRQRAVPAASLLLWGWAVLQLVFALIEGRGGFV